MRVIVLGAGLLGVTSAYYLQHLGHEVTVVDRHATPLSRLLLGSGVPPKRPAADAAPASDEASRIDLLRWHGAAVSRWLGRRLFGPHHGHDMAEQRAGLDAYSQETLRALLEDTGLPRTRRTPPSTGQLDFYTSVRDFGRAARRVAQWRALGAERLVLSADEALRLEPALAHVRPELAGAVYSATGDNAECDDPRDFGRELVQLCRAGGVRFLGHHELATLHEDQGRIDHIAVRGPGGALLHLRAEAYVLALGPESHRHAATLGITLRRSAVRDDEVTLPVLDARRVNRLQLRDHESGLRFARREVDGQECLQVHGMVRDDEAHCRPERERFEAMMRRTAMLFPGVADLGRARFQSTRREGQDALPWTGRTRLPNLFLNAAQGPMPWVHAVGTGKSIAWIVTGLRPPLQFVFTGL